MTLVATQSPALEASEDLEERDFLPGTTGWTAADLDDPRLGALWALGRHEIVEGALTLMPAATFDSSLALQNLIRMVQRHQDASGQQGFFAQEVDLVLSDTRVPRGDAVFLTPTELQRQREAHARSIADLPPRSRRRQTRSGRTLIPPTLVIESVSLGHELHDRQTKRQWYAEAGVPNYWILDVVQRALECYAREGGGYRPDQSGRDRDEVRPALFPGLIVPLAEVWLD